MTTSPALCTTKTGHRCGEDAPADGCLRRLWEWRSIDLLWRFSRARGELGRGKQRNDHDLGSYISTRMYLDGLVHMIRRRTNEDRPSTGIDLNVGTTRKHAVKIWRLEIQLQQP